MLNFRPPPTPTQPPPSLLRRPPCQVIYTGNDNIEAHIALDKSRESIRKTDSNLIGSILRGRKNSQRAILSLCCCLVSPRPTGRPYFLSPLLQTYFFVRYLDAGNVNISPKKRPHCFWATLNSEHHLLTQGWGKNGIIWVQLVQMRRGKKL